MKLGKDGWPTDQSIIAMRDKEIKSLRQQLVECQARNAEDGWRQCAKGQRTTQWCGATEEAIKQAKRDTLLEAADKFTGPLGRYDVADVLRRMAKEPTSNTVV